MRSRSLGLCLLLVLATGQAVSAAPDPIRVPTPYEAVQLAVQDLGTVPPDSQQFQRYFLVYDRTPEFYGAFDYVLNTCVSSSSVLVRSQVVANGWLIRVDLSQLAPKANEFENTFLEFEKLATLEPYFHTTGELVVQTEKPVLVKVPRYQHANGQWYTQRWEKQIVEETKIGTEHSLHLLGPAGQEAPILALARSCNSAIPIQRADWFMFVVTTQDPQENGRYYAFRRIQQSSSGKPAEQLWFEQQGFDYDTIKNLRSDQRIGMTRGNVTGQPRAIEYAFTSATRPSVGPAAVFITRDWFLGKVNAKRHPIKNLLNYDHDGSEAIGFLPNGMLTFALFDNKGDLLNVAPQKLVTDRTVPVPYPANLQPPISCFRCHGPTDMLMDAANHVQALTAGNLGINFFDDASSNTDPADTLDRLSGLYAGEIDETLRISRNTHANATFIVTGGMSIPEVTQKIGEVYSRYRYGAVTPQMACLELGWLVDAERSVASFNTILPALPPNRFGIRPESVTIGTLRSWTLKNNLFVTRSEWEQAYADAMLRVVTEEIRNQTR